MSSCVVCFRFLSRTSRSTQRRKQAGTRAIRNTHGLVTLPYPLFGQAYGTSFCQVDMTRGQDLAGQARRSHWRSCSVDSQRNSGNQLAILEQLTLLVALYIHDIVVQNGVSRRYAIIEKRMAISGTWSRKNRDKEHSASRDRPIVRPVPVATATEERGQKEERKRAREMGAQWISEDQCADGIFWCQTDNHVRIVAVLEIAVGCRGFGLLDAQ